MPQNATLDPPDVPHTERENGVPADDGDWTLRDRPGAVSVGSVPASALEVASEYDYVLTPDGVYEVLFRTRG